MREHLPKKVSAYLNSCLSALSKPQKKYLLIYLTGLIWLIKFRSIREIASVFGNHNTDGLHQFLKASPKKIGRLLEASQKQIVKSANTPETLLIIDDTPCPRQGGKIEGIGIHHGADGFIRGLCAVTSIVKVGTQRFVWAIQGYRPKSSCAKGVFKSKIQIALEILSQAKEKFNSPLTVLMDAWYACAPILNLIVQSQWTFLAAIKRNRIVEVGGRKIAMSRLAKGHHRKYQSIRSSKKRRFRVTKVLVYLPKVGSVLLFISKYQDSTRFFITNNLKMTESQMVELYLQRVWIETFHQDIKQHLGFSEMFMRSWDGGQTHWTLLMIAYNMIVLSNGTKSRSFRQMIRHFRDTFDSHRILKCFTH